MLSDLQFCFDQYQCTIRHYQPQPNKHPDIIGVYPNTRVSIGPNYATMTAKDSSTEQVVPPNIIRIAAEPGRTKYTGNGVGIAIVDTGIDYNHPDLTVSTNGYYAGRNPQWTAGAPLDDSGHGTHVAGIAAARNNGIGVVGVAPNATLYSVIVLGSEGD